MSLAENTIVENTHSKRISFSTQNESITVQGIEEKLIQLLSKLLPKRDDFSVDDNLFESGADSMTIIELISQAKAQGLKINIKQVSEYPTTVALARSIYQERLQNSFVSSEKAYLNEGLLHEFLLLPNQSGFAFTKSMTILTYVLKPTHKLDRNRLEHAFQLLVQRHEALRIRFVGKDFDWKQLITPYSSSPIVDYVHLDASLTEEQRKKAIHDYHEKLMLTLDVEDNSIAFRVALFEWKDEQLFFLAMDHYSVDELSMKLFWTEFQSSYLEKTLPPVEVPYSKTVENIYQLAETWDCKQDQTFWLKQHAKVVLLPKTAKPDTINEGIKAKAITLQSEDWLKKIILDIPASKNIQTHEILLTTWVQSVSSWGELPGIVLILGSHNRELLDEIVHTMGCFATAFPAYFEAPLQESALQSIENIRNQIKQIPHKGTRYMLSIMTDPKWKEQIFSASQPSLGFNYLGQEEVKERMWQEGHAEEVKGKMVSIRKGELLSGRHQAANAIPYLIMICQVNNEHHKITLTCEYDSAHYDEQAIAQLLEFYQERIESFAVQLS